METNLKKAEHPLFAYYRIVVPHVMGRCKCERITQLRSCYNCHELMCLECLAEHGVECYEVGE